MASLTANAGLVRKVAFARETLVFSQVIFCLVQFSIEIGLLSIALLFFGAHFVPWIPVVMFLMLLLAIFASGFALALSAASVYFRDLKYLWTIFIQVMFFATPIIYQPDRLEGKLPPVAEFFWEWNPAKVFIMEFRHMLYSGASPEWSKIGYLVVVSFMSFAIGWTIFKRLSRRIAEEL
jgi:ABC-type polysaccharide/polyol phosphate export permease